MSLTAIIIVVISAALHAGWNAVGKFYQASGTAFLLSATTAASVLLTPYIVWFGTRFPVEEISIQFWWILVVSGLCQMVYLTGLVYAYKNADVGIVYPLARGFPVLLVGAAIFLMGYSVSSNQWIGFFVLFIGCIFLPVTSLKELRFRDYLQPGILWASIAALGTAGYSVLDKEALNVLTHAMGLYVSNEYSAIYYLALQYWAMSVPIALWMICTRQYQQFETAWSIKGVASIAGIMMSTTYGLVLVAMSFTENVSLVVALRQVSIIFGLVIGVFWLGERFYIPRFFGALFIIVGLMVALT
ncbi:EamA family transporter [Halomonas marinisediminis]|uniref:Multidrug transporter n=1 Tax=Halomonas marinisediminis TaxID=2546095 RepID=A0ABY2D9T8_9GAMM|nr:EamA family transporter [Halomonas marinisediminis]TDB04801.1 multidrug transporter [Halomonas marinisediminis]